MNLRAFIKSPTFRLSASYLAIIMVMSIAFSAVFYSTSVRELEKRPNPDTYSEVYLHDPDHEINEWLRQQAENTKAGLVMNLALLNIFALFVGSGISYLLARKTLKPIESAMKIQERFIADASHELRTPLTSLLLTNEVTLRKKQLTVTDARRSIEQNVRDLNQLKQLSDDLLDLAASETVGKKKETDLYKIVLAASDQIKPLADEHHIVLHNDVEIVSVVSNEQKLIKLVVILLDNAIKYSESYKGIYLSSEVTEKHAILHIKDEGYGMTKDDMEHMFDRFYRADRSRSQASGHGLGLAIAVKIIGELGGTLSAKSTLGKGSVFSILLPK
ncbi:MAG TPA: HAMP domain-containing sensor histidine kinase [Candidatus Chromulinivoraceae bacterium]|nr:HAMP domain-containing sensor histidine kinase [Candidatus Chromulinivoraceae bacterium]